MGPFAAMLMECNGLQNAVFTVRALLGSGLALPTRMTEF
jgi:hypothetical protein